MDLGVPGNLLRDPVRVRAALAHREQPVITVTVCLEAEPFSDHEILGRDFTRPRTGGAPKAKGSSEMFTNAQRVARSINAIAWQATPCRLPDETEPFARGRFDIHAGELD